MRKGLLKFFCLLGLGQFSLPMMASPRPLSSNGSEVCVGDPTILSLDQNYGVSTFEWMMKSPGGEFKSVGNEMDDKGVFEAVVFIDANKNGKYDKKIDIPVKDVPIVTSWSSTPEYTNRSGRISSAALTSGIYKVSLDMDSLPITVAPMTNDLISKTIKIEDGLTTKLELPLVSTVGSVSGVLKISDDFDRDLRITDFVVIITDEEGHEVNYSTVDSSGEFYISGLAPGKYTLKLDDRYIDAYGLEKLQNLSERIIYIPFDYENPTDVINQNLEYRTLSL